jgi:hypothetical protein
MRPQSEDRKGLGRGEMGIGRVASLKGVGGFRSWESGGGG